MTAKTILSCILVITLVLLLVGLLNTGTAAYTNRPHIIIILTDDMGYSDVGYNGYGQIPTPNIDALASDGVILSNYYAQPLCTPSRSALMTGLYPIHTGMQNYVIRTTEPWGLPLKFKLMPQYLKDLGYATHLVGKWHLGFHKMAYAPTRRGFDSHVGYWAGFIDYFDHTGIMQKEVGVDFRWNMNVLKSLNGTYATNVFRTRTEQIIQNHDKRQPLFLFLSHLAVHAGNDHDPLQAPPGYAEAFAYINDTDRQKFAGMLHSLDEAVGHLVVELYKNGMLDNSIIVFSSDNGGRPVGFKRNWSFNYPLRGAKESLWQGGVLVPGFIWSPYLRRRSCVYDGLMHISDWLPTLYAAAGGLASNLPLLDGVNMWPALMYNLPSPRKEVLLNVFQEKFALIRGHHKLIHGDMLFNDWYKPNGSYLPYSSVQTAKYNSVTMKVICHRYPTAPICFRHRQWLYSKAYTSRLPSVSEIFGRPLYKKPYDPLFRSTLYSFDRGCITNQKEYETNTYSWPPIMMCYHNKCNNCLPEKELCLFDIKADPCECVNIADQWPQRVKEMLKRVQELNSTSMPPGNKPPDPKSFPSKHSGVWTNWNDPPELQALSAI